LVDSEEISYSPQIILYVIGSKS